jgi:hypothetical protein
VVLEVVEVLEFVAVLNESEEKRGTHKVKRWDPYLQLARRGTRGYWVPSLLLVEPLLYLDYPLKDVEIPLNDSERYEHDRQGQEYTILADRDTVHVCRWRPAGELVARRGTLLGRHALVGRCGC